MKTYGKVEQFTYCILRRKGLKNVTMRVDEEGLVKISAPYNVPTTQIENILVSNKDKLVSAVEKRKQAQHTYTQGDVFLFEGEPYVLTFRKGYQYRISVEDKQLAVTYFGPEPDTNIVSQLVKQAYAVHAMYRIKKMLPPLAKTLGLPTPTFRVRDSKKRWGSCSSDGKLSFSLRTQMLSDEQLTFLILHELAHLIHFDHSSDFHALLRSHMPNYKDVEKELFTLERQGVFVL